MDAEKQIVTMTKIGHQTTAYLHEEAERWFFTPSRDGAAELFANDAADLVLILTGQGADDSIIYAALAAQ